MIWLSPEVLSWSCDIPGTFTIDDDATWQRPYAMWRHAEELLSRRSSDFTRIDAITTMNRTVEHRTRLLATSCDLKKLPLAERPKESLEILAYVGAVRPLMLRKLNDIRNLVEHQDGKPPSHEECLVFLEFTWYFLRSTDLLAQPPPDSFELQSPDDAVYWVEVKVRKEGAIEYHLSGWVPANLISSNAVKGWLSITETRFHTRLEFPGDVNDIDIDRDCRGRYPEDVFFDGAVRGPAEALMMLIRKYLRVF